MAQAPTEMHRKFSNYERLNDQSIVAQLKSLKVLHYNRERLVVQALRCVVGLPIKCSFEIKTP